MKKPEKKEYQEEAITPGRKQMMDIYNQAYDIWEVYHNWRMSQLPSEQELYDLTLNYLGRLDGKTTKLIKAIYKRIRGKR